MLIPPKRFEGWKIEYTFSQHLDVYGGLSYSEANGGVASGYINDHLRIEIREQDSLQMAISE